MGERHFLFLQGPHGPFFGQLARALEAAGQTTHRIGFNIGDQMFWPLRDRYTAYTDDRADFPAFLESFLDRHPITDLVIYGDTRDIHVAAQKLARARGIAIHCFEEGYLRPYWVTYERNGTNGHSRLMRMSVAEMRALLRGSTADVPDAPAQWGALWHHVLLGMVYHTSILLFNRRYRGVRPHRAISVRQEAILHTIKTILFPVRVVRRRLDTRRLRVSGANYHLVLLQLAHDASFRDHSDFANIAEFIEICCAGFARGAPKHHRLVFKAHPLEDGREPIRAMIRDAAAKYDIVDRVQLIQGGKLGEMLDNATTAVTVNSTAGQQALWRGLPLKAFGRSVYSKPEFVSHQPIHEFFANPRRPDREAYLVYRQFLLESSQIPGGFYTAEGRADIIRHLCDVVLADQDPYDAVGHDSAAPVPQLSVEAT
ncbi:MAG: capsule biosynthesis protein CapA [Pseudomonadota bacterium]